MSFHDVFTGFAAFHAAAIMPARLGLPMLLTQNRLLRLLLVWQFSSPPTSERFDHDIDQADRLTGLHHYAIRSSGTVLPALAVTVIVIDRA